MGRPRVVRTESEQRAYEEQRRERKRLALQRHRANPEIRARELAAEAERKRKAREDPQVRAAEAQRRRDSLRDPEVRDAANAAKRARYAKWSRGRNHQVSGKRFVHGKRQPEEAPSTFTYETEACNANATSTSGMSDQRGLAGSLVSASKTRVEESRSPLPAEDKECPSPGIPSASLEALEPPPLGPVVHQASQLPSTGTDHGTVGRLCNQLTASSSCLPEIIPWSSDAAPLEPTESAEHTLADLEWMQLVLIAAANKQFQCCFCSYGTGDSRLLIRHLQVQTCMRPFRCQHCTESFYSQSARTRHSRIHVSACEPQDDEKPYKCHLCSKPFRSKSGWRRHLHLHTGDQLYRCSVCPKICLDRGLLVIHMRSHTGEKPFKCDHCQKCFASKGDLNCHTRTHTGERPFGCRLCPATFSTSSGLRHHARLHADERPYQCQSRPYTFTSLARLGDHVRRHKAAVSRATLGQPLFVLNTAQGAGAGDAGNFPQPLLGSTICSDAQITNAPQSTHVPEAHE